MDTKSKLYYFVSKFINGDGIPSISKVKFRRKYLHRVTISLNDVLIKLDFNEDRICWNIIVAEKENPAVLCDYYEIYASSWDYPAVVLLLDTYKLQDKILASVERHKGKIKRKKK